MQILKLRKTQGKSRKLIQKVYKAILVLKETIHIRISKSSKQTLVKIFSFANK